MSSIELCPVGRGCNSQACLRGMRLRTVHASLSACCANTRPATSHLPGLLQRKQQLEFRLRLRRPGLAFLWDHQVAGAAIMPGAAYFELVVAAGRTLAKVAEPSLTLTDAAIAAPLKLPAAAESPTVVLAAEVALMSAQVSIKSSSAEASKADLSTLHLRGSIAFTGASAPASAAAPTEQQAPLSAEVARAACQEPQATAGIYERLLSAGLQYGKEFRCVLVQSRERVCGEGVWRGCQWCCWMPLRSPTVLPPSCLTFADSVYPAFSSFQADARHPPGSRRRGGMDAGRRPRRQRHWIPPPPSRAGQLPTAGCCCSRGGGTRCGPWRLSRWCLCACRLGYICCALPSGPGWHCSCSRSARCRLGSQASSGCHLPRPRPAGWHWHCVGSAGWPGGQAAARLWWQQASSCCCCRPERATAV